MIERKIKGNIYSWEVVINNLQSNKLYMSLLKIKKKNNDNYKIKVMKTLINIIILHKKTVSLCRI